MYVRLRQLVASEVKIAYNTSMFLTKNQQQAFDNYPKVLHQPKIQKIS
jgi:hypothetical protein